MRLSGNTLSEDEKKYEDALKLTRRATLVAQQVNAPESLYLWQWQTGRFLKAMGNTGEAISAFRNCIYTLQSIRQEMPTCYGTPQISYRESVEPIYFGFVDLLLQQTTFSIANDVAKYFAIIPALFTGTYPALAALNIMGLHNPLSTILAAVIFNALIIIALVPLALRGVRFRPMGAAALLRRNLLIYGLGQGSPLPSPGSS